MEERKTVLSVEHLSVKFTQYERGFRQIELPAIRDLRSYGEGRGNGGGGSSSGSGKRPPGPRRAGESFRITP